MSLSIWTIYERPSDYPDLYVVREFKITAEGPVPSPVMALSTDLEHARRSVSEGRYCIPRSVDDDPTIVESWI